MNRNEAWEELFKIHCIVERVDECGQFDITAQQINGIGGPDARLMAKIDSRENLPSVMAKNNLAMLAIGNGKYRIGRFDPFFQIPEKHEGPVRTVAFPKDIITLDPTYIGTESAALDVATVTGMLDEAFGEHVQLTIRGRTRAGADFNFTLGNVSFSVAGVQVEVDGGYEGRNTVDLVEAKIGGKSNLTVRQILYPQRCWEKLIPRAKSVRSYVFLYQEPLFRFVPVLCSGIAVVADSENEMAFRIEENGTFDLKDIRIEGSEPLVDLNSPFPQADDFGKALAMLSIVSGAGGALKSALSLEFDITGRQIDYYYAALRWMKLCIDRDGQILLSKRGMEIARMSHLKKIRALAEIVFSEPIFHRALGHGVPASSSDLWNRWNLNTTTRERRRHTVTSWVEYFNEMQAAGYPN